MSIDGNDFGFATSIDDTLTQAETELLVLNETVDSINELKSYELAVIELCERIKRIIDENKMLNEAIAKIKTFGTDYRKMTEGAAIRIRGICQFNGSSYDVTCKSYYGTSAKVL